MGLFRLIGINKKRLSEIGDFIYACNNKATYHDIYIDLTLNYEGMELNCALILLGQAIANSQLKKGMMKGLKKAGEKWEEDIE